MENDYYDMIFKRKSFHIFSGRNHLSPEELREIECRFSALTPLVADIKTAWRIVPKKETTCRRGEYCILIYSETKPHSLLNTGYMAEQLDLWLAHKNIGACWYGMGKTKEQRYKDLPFVIMIAIEKAEEKEFRRDYTKAKRKPLSEIWTDKPYDEIAQVVRYAPSACNTQPWLVNFENGRLFVQRVPGKRGVMPKAKVSYYNGIDMGIFLLFLELSLAHEKKSLHRELCPDTQSDSGQTPVAVYTIIPDEK